jgi:hypothetical protein
VFSLKEKDDNKLAGNWFQLLMVLFTKEYLPTYILLFKKIHWTQHAMEITSLGSIWSDNKNIPLVYVIIICLEYLGQSVRQGKAIATDGHRLRWRTGKKVTRTRGC